MNIRICNVNGFICDADFKGALEHCSGSYNCIVLLSTREINGDIAVSRDNIPAVKSAYEKFIKELKKHTDKLILILDEWYRPYDSIFNRTEVDDILYVNSFLYTTYRRIIVHKESNAVQKYQLNENNKCLFLINKTASIHRIGLLYKLSKKNLLDRSLYSFIMPSEFTQTESKKALDCMLELEHSSVLSKKEFDNFYNDNKRVLDLSYNEDALRAVNYTHYTGIPYNEQLFSECNFQLISETHFDMTVWMTEKTWISIINKRPFIMAAYPGFLRKLKELGFRTFEEYLKIPNYDSITNDTDRLNAITENVQYWLTDIDKYYESINRDVNYNFETFLLLSKQEEVKINNMIKKHSLPCDCDIVSSHDNYNNEISFNKE